MSSIRIRIMLAIIIFAVLSGTIVGFTGLYTSNNILERYSRDNAELTVDSAAGELDSKINAIQNSVDGLSITAVSLLDNLERFKTDGEYVRQYEETLRPIAAQFADETEGAMSFYVRFNPAFTAPTSGIFHADSDDSGKMQQLTPTDFSQYDPSDTAHVGWYYLPVQSGKAMWLDPYRNENIGVDMISYTVPLFKNGESVGIVGMDIRFDLFQSFLGDIRTFDDTYAVLVNSSQKLLIDPVHTEAAVLKDVDAAFAQKVEQEPKGVMLTEWGGEETLVAYANLSNDYTLIVASPTHDIYQEVNQQTWLILYLLLSVIVLAVLTALLVGSRMVRPLKRIVADMELVSAGQLDVQSRYTGKDEIGRIGSGFNHMVQQLRRLTGSIKETTVEIGQSSHTLLAVSQQTTAAAQEMTASVAEIAKGNRSQSAMLASCADTATELADQASALREQTEEVWQGIVQMNEGNEQGLALMQELARRNDSSNEATQQIGEIISDLRSKAESVNQILTTISGIAKQTGILALNASIEASRAGESGRSFAVVAEEVGKLAQQSREATEETVALISGVQQDIGKTVVSMADVREQSSRQSEVVKQMDEALRHISLSVSGSTRQIKESSEHIAKLSIGVGQVHEQLGSLAVIAAQSSDLSNQVAEAVEEQTDGFEQVTAAAEQLGELVERLDSAVQAFHAEGSGLAGSEREGSAV